MPNDPYYRSAEWRALRAAALHRDLYTCVVPGCYAPAKIVDHIISRANGGKNELPNLRSLCVEHDNQVKENSRGVRRAGGKLAVKDMGANGWPLDPNHDWNRGR